MGIRDMLDKLKSKDHLPHEKVERYIQRAEQRDAELERRLKNLQDQADVYRRTITTG